MSPLNDSTLSPEYKLTYPPLETSLPPPITFISPPRDKAGPAAKNELCE